MPGKIHDGASWRNLSHAFARVGTDWKRVNRAWINDGTSWRTAFLAQIQDTFDRANSSSLGTTSDGSATWSNLRDSWGISSNSAQSTGAASGYPSATLQTEGPKVVATVAPGPGTGIIFGVQDSNNWYGAYVSARSAQVSCNCQEQCGTCYYSCTVCNSNCGSYSCEPCGCAQYWESYKKYVNVYSCDYDILLGGYKWVYVTSYWDNTKICFVCSGSGLGACNGVTDGNTGYVTSCSSNGQDTSCGCRVSGGCSTCYNCCTQADPSCGSYACCNTVCQNCVNVYWSVRLVRCVNGTVTEVAAQEGGPNGAQPTLLAVETGASTITVTGTAPGTTLSVTANASVSGTRHGVIKAPSPYNQSSVVDNFTVESL